MGFSPEEKIELRTAFEEIVSMTRDTLKKEESYPGSITNNKSKTGVTIQLRKLYPASELDSLADQTAILAYNFPPGSIVKVLEAVDDGVKGRVEGYRPGAHKNRPDEMALIVDIPGDTWILYPDQVELLDVNG